MRLSTWVSRRGRGEIARLARVVGCHHNTIGYLVAGKRPATYRLAAAIARATNHAVTVAELCAPPKRRKRARRRTATRKRRKGLIAA